jgi:hypothetical protein
MTKKILTGFVLSLLAVTFLGAQSLAELSKKEKERRAALKGKQTVVTNKDLGKTKKKAAMTETAAGESVLPPGAPTEVQPAVAGAVKPAPQAAPGEAPPVDQAPPEPAAEAGKETSANDQALDRQKTALQDKWNRAQELVDLLTMKMNALWQQLYSMDDMTEKESIQRQISDTYEKLLKAQEESTAAGDELTAFLSRERR